MKRILIASILMAVGLSSAIAWKIRDQREALEGPPTGSAALESEGVDVSARIGARVARVGVQEGARVEAGATLVELECDEPMARLAEAQARLASARAQAQAGHAQAQAAKRQSQAARASIVAAKATAEAYDSQRGAAEREATRIAAMGEYATVAQHDQTSSAASGLRAQAEAARAAGNASIREAAAVSSQATAQVAQALAAERSVEALEAVVRSAQLAVDECRIAAPRSGVVERVYYDPGELVSSGAVVARVVDPDVVKATFYLANADVDLAAVGLEAVVRADAIADQTWTGRVRRIGLEAEFTPRNIQTRSDRDRLVYPVEVRVPNTDHRLRAGMNVSVTLATRPAQAAR